MGSGATPGVVDCFEEEEFSRWFLELCSQNLSANVNCNATVDSNINSEPQGSSCIPECHNSLEQCIQNEVEFRDRMKSGSSNTDDITERISDETAVESNGLDNGSVSLKQEKSVMYVDLFPEDPECIMTNEKLEEFEETEYKKAKNNSASVEDNFVQTAAKVCWCKLCSLFFDSITNYVNHLRSGKHLQRNRVDKNSWLRTLPGPENRCTKKKGEETQCGVEFIDSVPVFICNLCKVVMWDKKEVKYHPYSSQHVQNFKMHMVENLRENLKFVQRKSLEYLSYSEVRKNENSNENISDLVPVYDCDDLVDIEGPLERNGVSLTLEKNKNSMQESDISGVQVPTRELTLCPSENPLLKMNDADIQNTSQNVIEPQTGNNTNPSNVAHRMIVSDSRCSTVYANEITGVCRSGEVALSTSCMTSRHDHSLGDGARDTAVVDAVNNPVNLDRPCIANISKEIQIEEVPLVDLTDSTDNTIDQEVVNAMEISKGSLGMDESCKQPVDDAEKSNLDGTEVVEEKVVSTAANSTIPLISPAVMKQLEDRSCLNDSMHSVEKTCKQTEDSVRNAELTSSSQIYLQELASKMPSSLNLALHKNSFTETIVPTLDIPSEQEALCVKNSKLSNKSSEKKASRLIVSKLNCIQFVRKSNMNDCLNNSESVYSFKATKRKKNDDLSVSKDSNCLDGKAYKKKANLHRKTKSDSCLHIGSLENIRRSLSSESNTELAISKKTVEVLKSIGNNEEKLDPCRTGSAQTSVSSKKVDAGIKLLKKHKKLNKDKNGTEKLKKLKTSKIVKKNRTNKKKQPEKEKLKQAK